jgi:hypothetical protein
MVGFAIFDNNPFDVRSTKSTNTGRQAFTAKQAFIGPGAKIEDAIIKGSKPLYTENPKNNLGGSQEGFFPQRDNRDNRDNLDLSKSIFSPGLANNVAQAYVGSLMPNRLSGNDPKNSLFSSFGSPKEKLAQVVGRQLVLSA